MKKLLLRSILAMVLYSLFISCARQENSPTLEPEVEKDIWYVGENESTEDAASGTEKDKTTEQLREEYTNVSSEYDLPVIEDDSPVQVSFFFDYNAETPSGQGGAVRRRTGKCKAVVDLSQENKIYLPKSSKHLIDKTYMNNMEALLFEASQKAFKGNAQFFNIVKAVAWTESSWGHYINNGKEIALVSSEEPDGCSWGIMQIYDAYHEKKYNVRENVYYGVAFLKKIYSIASKSDCKSGPNKGTGGLARRVYAIYNGGEGNMCRNHVHDNNFTKNLSSSPWERYLK